MSTEISEPQSPKVNDSEMKVLQAMWLLLVQGHVSVTVDQIKQQMDSLPKPQRQNGEAAANGNHSATTFADIWKKGVSLVMNFSRSSETEAALKSLETKNLIKGVTDHSDGHKMKYRMEKSTPHLVFDHDRRYEYPYPNGILTL